MGKKEQYENAKVTMASKLEGVSIKDKIKIMGKLKKCFMIAAQCRLCSRKMYAKPDMALTDYCPRCQKSMEEILEDE